MTSVNMSSEADRPLNLTTCLEATAGDNSSTMTAGYKANLFTAETKMSPRRVLTNTSSSGSDPLASPSNETVCDVDGHGDLAGNTGLGACTMSESAASHVMMPGLNSTPLKAAHLFNLEKQYYLQKELINRQFEDDPSFIEQEHYRMQLLLKQKQQLFQQLSDESGDRVEVEEPSPQRRHVQQAQIEHIKHKRKDEESAVASSAVKLKLRECLLNKSQRELHNMSNSPPEFRHWSTQHSSLEQHSPPTIEWSPPLKLSLEQCDEEYPLRKTVSEPSLKMRSSKLSLRQKVIQRNSHLMRKREVYRQRIPAALDHDDSPNSPPSVVSSQGSSVDISIREDHRISGPADDHLNRGAQLSTVGVLSSSDAEIMLAMSRQYGSLPQMGYWPPFSLSGADPSSVEAQMKVLELAHSSGGQPAPANAGYNNVANYPSVANGSHLNDPHVQALMMARCTLQRTRSEPIPLPVQLLLQQHKMLLNKQQQDQQLKENHKFYLKKKLLHQASTKKLHMENVDESVESRVAREHLNVASESEEEADVIVIDDPICESDDSAIQPDSARLAVRRRRAFLDRTRTRTLSCGPLTSSSSFFSDRLSMECGQSPSIMNVHPPTTVSSDKRHFVTGLAYDSAMLKHSCLCQNNAIHPENPGRLISIWNRLSVTGLIDKCEMVKCRRATREELQTCHSEAYVHMYASSARHRDPAIFELFAPRFCKLMCGGIGVDVDTVWHEDETVLASRLAAGCSIELTMKVACGELDNGFALVRPPGHHAEDTQAMGFCFFNSIGISTKLLLERLNVRRLLIVDWDVHHGNSTQQLFYADPRVLYISMHRYDDGNFFPGTGASTECGIERGTGFTVNVAWTGAVMGDAEYLSAFRTIIMPIAREFRPEMVLVSAGFDAAAGHPAPLGGYKVSPQCFGHMTQQLMTLADRKVALILEGGYEVEPLCDCAEACLRALLNEKIDLPVESELCRSPCRSAIETLKTTIKCQVNYWPCVIKLADTLELSYLEAQHRLREEADTVTAFAGLSVMSNSTPGNCLQQQRPDSTTDIAEESEPMDDG